MPVSARDVAAVLRARQPGMPVKKLHKLLYYCQGQHLAAFERPLFAETVFADDTGPVVDARWHHERHERELRAPRDFGEVRLSSIGYVLSRYGALSLIELEHLTRGEPPWQLADAGRTPGGRARIERDWMRDYFRGAGAPGADLPQFDDGAVATLVAGAEERRRAGPGKPTTWAEISRLIDGA